MASTGTARQKQLDKLEASVESLLREGADLGNLIDRIYELGCKHGAEDLLIDLRDLDGLSEDGLAIAAKNNGIRI